MGWVDPPADPLAIAPGTSPPSRVRHPAIVCQNWRRSTRQAARLRRCGRSRPRQGDRRRSRRWCGPPIEWRIGFPHAHRREPKVGVNGRSLRQIPNLTAAGVNDKKLPRASVSQPGTTETFEPPHNRNRLTIGFGAWCDPARASPPGLVAARSTGDRQAALKPMFHRPDTRHVASAIDEACPAVRRSNLAHSL